MGISEKVQTTALENIAEEFNQNSKGAGKVLGESALIIAKTVRSLVTPLEGFVWGMDAIKANFYPQVEAKLKNIPDEKRIEPDPLIAGPVLQAVRFATRHEELQDLFANLLATSIDASTAQNAHPAFVGIANQLSPDEAKILRFLSNKDSIPVIDVNLLIKGSTDYNVLFKNVSTLPADTGCQYTLGPSYIDNLCRLKICDKPGFGEIRSPEAYSRILDKSFLENIEQIEKQSDRKTQIEKKYLVVTSFGRQFINACVMSKNDATKI